MTDNKEKFRQEIASRMHNDLWDYKMAGRVMEQQRLKKEKMLRGGSIISTAVAAIAVFVFIFDLAIERSETGYSESYYAVSADSENELYAAADVEYIINEAYPMR